ncbi:MAG TPA: copper transporter [Actinomycetota bacterium]|nr:copper transporter [Actinomycetota bacterium]
MISFRYHVVTIVAVFLALAIGLLGGAAFVQPALQEELQNQTDRLRRDLADRTRQIGDLREQIGALGGFAEAAMPYLTNGKLSATPIVLVSQVGVEDEVLAQAQESLAQAGARILTTVAATEELVSDDPATHEQLALMLGAPTAPAEELPGLAADALAQRFSSQQVIGDDILAELLSAGFLAPVGAGPSAATLDEIGADGQVVVVLSGGRGEQPVLAPEAFAVPLTEQLAALGVPVAAGESLLSDYDYVSLVRSNGTEGTVTVDDLDQTMGGAALVLGLEELLATGDGGAYGVKDGAEPLPPLP